ncbi:glycoside hydrolase family 32 protein [Thalassoglobus sp. JC818]|uniref:glycoside hydrolase family 32 protein n=1 Tax=Thalassoglobus sp. JC818 TaxID=3232136 RepID=UPI0034580FB7
MRSFLNLLAPALLLFIVLGQSNLLAAETLFDFEGDGFGAWSVEGAAFGETPVVGKTLSVEGYKGRRFLNSFHGGDPAQGELISPEFVISDQFIVFLISGGRHPGKTGAELIIDDEAVRSATGNHSGVMEWRTWDVSELKGKKAKLRIFDQATGDWGHINLDHVLLTSQPRINPGQVRLDQYRRTPWYYREQFRPQFHFTPELNWMNDPNGLVYHDGEYHLFYQHNPHGNGWGHMSWGHAVSRDLCHWEHLPIALHEEYGTMIFSGSAVVDSNNTSGFGTLENPPMVAIYTGNGHGKQTQDLAYSLDNGRHWTKYSKNPVLDLDEAHFRDPKVFWHSPTNRWVMVVSLAAKKIIQFYGSPNLKDWTLLSEFGPAGVDTKPNWECPDVFELPIEGKPGETGWVLEADIGGGSIAGGSGGEYFVGEFDGTTFQADSKESQWVDFGRDFYAPISWDNIPSEDGRRIWIGWMNNWETALVPTSPWRSSMSIPRALSLREVDGSLRLIQRPVQELEKLRGQEKQLTNVAINGDQAVPLDSLNSRQREIIAEFEVGDAEEFGLRVCEGPDERTVIGVRPQASEVFVDRTQSGEVEFHPAFPGRHAAPISIKNGRVQLHIFVDTSSVELFANDGEITITDRIFPSEASDGVTLYSKEGTARLVSLQIWELNSIWHNPKEQ